MVQYEIDTEMMGNLWIGGGIHLCQFRNILQNLIDTSSDCNIKVTILCPAINDNDDIIPTDIWNEALERHSALYPESWLVRC